MPVWMLRWPQRLSEALELTSLPLACTPQAQGPQGGGGRGKKEGSGGPRAQGLSLAVSTSCSEFMLLLELGCWSQTSRALSASATDSAGDSPLSGPLLTQL